MRFPEGSVKLEITNSRRRQGRLAEMRRMFFSMDPSEASSG